VPLVHADLYRIEDARELAELGLVDAFDRAAVAIEWLDRFPDAAPAERLEIAIEFAGGDARRLTFRPVGRRATELTDHFRSPRPAERGEG
jgi:tRNA threonylcarbamoyladenosine biosynthesis protein TsaE